MNENPGKGKSIIVTVTDEALGNIHQLADKLTKKGMNIKRVLPITGIISGFYSSSLSNIRKIKGVKNAEDEASAQF